MKPFTFALLAHQGGWDEILLVVGPIAVIIGLLAVVRRRLGRLTPPAADERAESDLARRDPLDRGAE